MGPRKLLESGSRHPSYLAASDTTFSNTSGFDFSRWIGIGRDRYIYINCVTSHLYNKPQKVESHEWRNRATSHAWMTLESFCFVFLLGLFGLFESKAGRWRIVRPGHGCWCRTGKDGVSLGRMEGTRDSPAHPACRFFSCPYKQWSRPGL